MLIISKVYKKNADIYIKGTIIRKSDKMGLGSSSVRLLSLIGRKNSISRSQIHYANEKEDLTRNMQAVSRKYQQALSTKVLKWSNNSGIEYTDITYNTLMRPCTANSSKPFVLANSSGKVVLDSKYKKYAEKFSPNGKIVGDWSTHRNEILSDLTGFSVSDLETYEASNNVVQAKWDNYYKLGEERLNYKKNEVKTSNETYSKIVKKLTGDLSKGTKTIRTEADLKAITDSVYNSLSKYFIDADSHTLLNGYNTRQDLKERCDQFYSTYSSVVNYSLQSKKMRESGNSLPFSGSAGNVKVDITKLIEHIVGGLKADSTNSSGDKIYVFRDTSTKEWQNWYNTLQAKDQAVQDAYKEYQDVLNIDNQIFTKSQEQQIEFYDQLFTAVAENGWVEDYSANDSNYLNQMLQNNEYVIMTMVKNADYVTSKNDIGYQAAHTKNKYDYSIDIASNCEYIFPVSDSDLRQEALVEYENEKAIINAKETKIDQIMDNLNTEMSAIMKMITGIETQVKDNIERTMKITG